MVRAFVRLSKLHFSKWSSTQSGAWLLGLLVVTAFLFSPATQLSVQAATDDTPVPFAVDGNVEEWSVGAGLVYWANNCFADEFNPIAELRRKPAGGGSPLLVQAVNAETEPDDTCITFTNQLSSGDGLYYYEEDFSGDDRIMRIPLSAPYAPEVVKALAANEAPTNRRPFVEHEGYLYWPVNFTNKIFRTLKDGSGPVETVAETNPGPLDLIIVGTTMYWTDSVGVFGKSINCDEVPCEGQSKYDDFPDNAFAFGLIYKPTSGFFPGQDGFRLYWVEQHNGNYSIVYRACNFNIVCFLEEAPNPDGPTKEPPNPTVFHTASSGRSIGDLLLVGDNIFWTESGPATGDLYRKAYNADLATSPANLATEQTGINPFLYAVGNNLFFARRGSGLGIYTLPLDATPILRDLSLQAFEVTQGIQNLANEVTLVAEKATYVRAFATQVSGPNTANVELHLVGTRNDQPLPGSPLKPVNGVRGLVTGGAFDRARLNDGWYFLLPPSWTEAGNVQLQLVIDPRHLHTDPNLTDNVLPQSGPKQFNFQNQPPVCVVTVPVRTHTPKPSVYDPNFGLMVSNFDRRWPVPETWIFQDTDSVEELQICTWYGVPYPCFGPYELEDGWGLTNGMPDRDKVIASLWTRAQLSFNPDVCDDISAPVHHMGLVHPDANNGGMNGYASTISNQSWVQLPEHGPITPAWNAMREGDTMAQELAHNHGRKHVDCGGPDDIDNGYPYNPCYLGPNIATDYYGFDIATLQPIRPTQAADFMSYATRRWVSDYTWEALLGKFATTSVATVAPQELAQGENVFVTGLVDESQARGEITLILTLDAGTLPTTTRQMLNVNAAGLLHDGEAHVTYKLRLLGEDGEPVIPDRTLTLVPMDDHQPDSENALFQDLFPKPSAPVKTIQLIGGDTVVDTIEVGPAEPVVTLLQPNAGTVVDDELTIEWTATDADENDRLTFTIQYSYNNGEHWHTLAVNLPGTPEPLNTFTLTDLGMLHGSAPNQAKIRVLATDGYNTGEAVSTGFTLTNRPPQPVIYAPSDGQTLPGGEGVVLQGLATDAEDGGLPDNALRWQVDGVEVGSGTTLAVNGLASDAHTASFSATDANNQTVTTTVNFNIAPLSVPLDAAPALDGACSDAAYATAINLPLAAYNETAQATVYLLRSNDYLWVCFDNLLPGAPGAYVGLRADLDNSRDPLAQASDAGFFVGENGDVFTRQGDGAGSFVAPGPGGLQGQIMTGTGSWSAELRIDQATLGGWNHVINLALGHHAVAAANDDYAWPFRAAWAKPNTWSAAALGLQPVLNVVSPNSAPVLSAARTITVEGSNLISGTQVLWDGTPLPTTWITDNVLTAQVGNAQLNTAKSVQITALSPDDIASNALGFVVEAAPPTITSLAPASAKAGSGPLQLTINGSNFTADSTVLWNGVEVEPEFVNASRLRVQIGASLLETGGIAGVAVSNPTPTAQISAVEEFEVLSEQASSGTIFIPGLYKEP